MKFFAILFVLASWVIAFPSRMFDGSMSAEEKRAITDAAAAIKASTIKEKRVPGFDASQQYISNTGTHRYIAPGPNDLRGPCPGLNALANHNYLPRNGIATIDQFIQANTQVFGMGLDLATALSVYGAVFSGDLTSWSIGGPPPAGLLSSIGLLGRPQGISRAHNTYEGDASATRPDLYQYGNAYKLILSQFEQLYTTPLGPRGYDISVMNIFRAKRFQQSIDNNPYFFNGPFTGVIVTAAGYYFTYRLMANHSATYPEGYLDGNVLKSFFAVTGSPGSFVWNEGQERIPDNWYRRAIGDEYGFPSASFDISTSALQYPQFLSVGGNTGRVKTFTGVNVTSLTNGVYNAQSLLQGNNAICFGFQFAQLAAPDILRGLFWSIIGPLSQLRSVLTSIITQLTCPTLQSIDQSQFANYPGSQVPS